MTRDEAIKKVRRVPTADKYASVFVDNLVELGLLKLETTEDKVRNAAAELLTCMHIGVFGVQPGGHLTSTTAKITKGGALAVLDILIKSGFRITRDEK